MKIMNYVRKVVCTVIICLAIFLIYLSAVNSEMVSGMHGNYFSNVPLDREEVINEVMFCQQKDEQLIVRLKFLENGEMVYRPLKNKDFAYESALESLKAAKIYVQSAPGEIVVAHYTEKRGVLYFMSHEVIGPGKYTLNIVLPEIKDQPSNINVHASKTAEHRMFQGSMIRKHAKCH